MKMHGLDGKTIKGVKYDSEWKESVIVTFTDGTVAMIYPYIVDGNDWPTMTISIFKETE